MEKKKNKPHKETAKEDNIEMTDNKENISLNGDYLSSASQNLREVSSFGVLNFDGVEDEIKTATIWKEGDYQIELVGTGSGKMDYTLYFPQTRETREFSNVIIQAGMKMNSVASTSIPTQLQIDRNADGTIDETLFAGNSGTIPIVAATPPSVNRERTADDSNPNNGLLVRITLCLIVIAVLIIVFIIIARKGSKGKKTISRRVSYGNYRTVNKQRTESTRSDALHTKPVTRQQQYEKNVKNAAQFAALDQSDESIWNYQPYQPEEIQRNYSTDYFSSVRSSEQSSDASVGNEKTVDKRVRRSDRHKSV